MIQVSEKAAAKIKTLKEEEGVTDNEFLRVFVEKGGCSGYSYMMTFDSELRSGDKTIEVGGEKVVVDTESILYLAGTTLDYVGGLNGPGFVFSNPNAKKTCGCGSSFNI